MLEKILETAKEHGIHVRVTQGRELASLVAQLVEGWDICGCGNRECDLFRNPANGEYEPFPEYPEEPALAWGIAKRLLEEQKDGEVGRSYHARNGCYWYAQMGSQPETAARARKYPWGWAWGKTAEEAICLAAVQLELSKRVIQKVQAEAQAPP